nr:hypothetical protein BaRGS_025140 [Batillaria attramentaria]
MRRRLISVSKAHHRNGGKTREEKSGYIDACGMYHILEPEDEDLSDQDLYAKILKAPLGRKQKMERLEPEQQLLQQQLNNLRCRQVTMRRNSKRKPMCT